ncbi:MAG: hypothetical protein AAF573_22655, partial [Bacteroidota bacterium]
KIMTAERFTYYLNNPSHLYQISYQELKSLVVQYPYCQNLRYMLLAKSQIENSDEYQKDLELAATYSADRTVLYNLMKNKMAEGTPEDSFVLNEDYLELKDLSATSTEELNLSNSAEPVEADSTSFEKENEAILAEATAIIANDTENDSPPKVETELNLESDIQDEAQTLTTDPEKTEAQEELSATESSTAITDNNSTSKEHPQEESKETDAEVSEASEMINYMKKPKKRKSVIDQLLMKYSKEMTATPNEIKSPILEENIISEDELESPASEDGFTDLTPVKGNTTIDREVLFEITNKTDQEMDALMHKSAKEEPEAVEHSNENIVTIENLSDEQTASDTKNTTEMKPTPPVPKSSFKSYMEQFQPPSVIDELEEEQEIENVIEEVVQEEILAANTTLTKKEKPKGKKDKAKKKKKQKAKKKKQKKDKKKDKNKAKKKSKKEKKKKTKIPKAAKQSIQENEDIVSETLAALLAQQGSRKKAIQMYKRLSLIFPEKSSFFAKKIEKLKK